MMSAEQSIATDKRRLVIGLGETGRSVAYYLKKQGLPFALADTRAEPPYARELTERMPETDIRLGEVPTEWVEKADELVISPGFDPRREMIRQAKESGKSVVGDLELFCRVATRPIVAVSGSNAKSTVVSLLSHIADSLKLNAPCGGNLGKPVLSLLDEKADLYILEVSSFQLETTDSMHADPACLLNLSQDHLDRYKNLEDYYRAKQRIFSGCASAVFNRDDKLTRPLFLPANRVRRFGGGPPDIGDFGLLFKGEETYLACGGKFLLGTRELLLRGRHNHTNVLAALAMADLLGWLDVQREAVLNACKTFRPLPHRYESAGTHTGVEYINDSKATNPGATCAALRGVAHDYKFVHLILGGSSKQADFGELAKELAKIPCRVYLIGEEGKRIREFLLPGTEYLLFSKEEHRKDGLTAAFQRIAGEAQAGELVLLSPACASYDDYRDYAERGTHFKELVKSLVKTGAEENED